ncbi:glycoside hydrolase [Epithele typhae]|uniref:glycoside hydrolase n=1 Tax=Epithele typhae TaxID=378194 RepID=UPI002008E6EE|nr:glycoside hydrolase [Epithele typhae]KAH9914637.1 glycoside hydrolase [Epithele typhae]
MSEGSLRKRNGAGTKSDATKGKSAGNPTDAKQSVGQEATSGGSSTIVYFVVLLVSATFGALVYKDPSIVKGPLYEFLGFEEDPFSPPTPQGFAADLLKRDAVRDAFKHAWLAYERDAMGWDEYHPISHKGTNLTEAGGIGYTVIDSIDTMLIMGLDEEYQRARKWVEEKMDFDRDGNFNTFETTIRVLGGLLSAYALTKDKLYVDKAVDLADRILPAFDTPAGLPLSSVNLAQRKGISSADNNGLVSTAEISTLQLEFRYLSYLTENEEYWDAVEKVMATIKKSSLTNGLASIFMNPEDGRFVLSAIRLGSRGDSYYEYLLKQYLQTNMTEPVYQDMYNFAMDAVHAHLISKSQFTKMTYTSELVPERDRMGQISWRLTPKQDHLVCFFGGSLMLGATTSGAQVHPVSVPPLPKELTKTGKRDWEVGEELIETCMRTHETATGLSPEIAHFRIPSDGLVGSSISQDWYIKGAALGQPAPYDARYILRPETVESLFIAYRLTGDAKYRRYGWDIFQAIEKHCRIETGGYASVINVDALPVEHEDKMETFLMSETLKYLYLLFEDDSVIPLSEYVFNTEAHPVPIINPHRRASFS